MNSLRQLWLIVATTFCPRGRILLEDEQASLTAFATPSVDSAPHSTFFSIMFFHALVPSWFVRIFSLSPKALALPLAETDGPASQVKGDRTPTRARLARGICAATNVGLGIRAFHNNIGKSSLTHSISKTSSETGSDLDELPDTISTTSATDSRSSSSTSGEDTLLRTPDACSPVDEPVQDGHCSAFHFSGFSDAFAREQSDSEVDYSFLDATVPPVSDSPLSTTDVHLVEWPDMVQHSWLADYCEELRNSFSLDNSDDELLSRASSQLSGSQTSELPEDSSDDGDEVYFQPMSGEPLKSWTAKHQRSVYFSQPVSWSKVPYGPRSHVGATQSATEALKNGNVTEYVEPEYVAGTQPAEPSILYHGDNLFLVRWLCGAGSFGKVMVANDKHGSLVAIKVVHKDKQYMNEVGRYGLIRELEIMDVATMTRSRFVVPLLESFADQQNVHFVMVNVLFSCVIKGICSLFPKPYYPETLYDRMERKNLTMEEVKLYSAELVRHRFSLAANTADIYGRFLDWPLFTRL